MQAHARPHAPASTSEVYGDPQIHPQVESYWVNVNANGPCYDEGKRVAETLCFDYHRQNGVDVRVVRIFNTYGPRMLMDDGRVVSNFVVQALTGDPITLYGDGEQTRSFCHVSDLVDGLIEVLNQDGEPGRSSSASRTSSPPGSSPTRSSTSAAARASSSTSLSRRTTPSGDSRTSAAPRTGCPGSRASSSRRGLKQTIAYFDEPLGWGDVDRLRMRTTER